MVKAYLRYELSATFGVVASDCNIVYDTSGKLLISASLENLSVWNVKQGSLVRTLSSASSSSNGKAAAPVTHIEVSPSGAQVAAGYADGVVRLWNHVNGECVVTLNGHKGAVTALRFNRSGALLASGSQDTDVIVWDVVGEVGLYRLRGHHDEITGLAFLERGNRLISSAKDSYIKVWELLTQHCSQTLVGHRGEVWAVDVSPSEDRLATGSSDNEMRLYEILHDEVQGPSTSYEVLRAMGSVRRLANERVVTLRYNATGTMLACQSAGKMLEVFRVRSEMEARKHQKRRKKRKRDKAHKGGDAGEAEDLVDDDFNASPVASDEVAPLLVVRAKQKVRSFAFSPAAPQKGDLAQIALALSNNSLEVWKVAEAEALRLHAIDTAGHRSDVRAVVLSDNDELLLSGSSSSVKIWNPHTTACLRTIPSSYVLCALFAPGHRHAVVGTKEGRLEILDVGAAEQVEAVAAHSGPVWSVAALPDGSGFVSGSADKDVKLWEWHISMEHDEHDVRRLGITHVRTLKMTDDVLCVRASPSGKYLAVALLDSTIKVLFIDTLKFFLSLYGHKLPVLSMDISTDGTLLVSGSADKNIKVWGLDFGDCHRSLFAHADSVMQVAFVPHTHYVFSVGKDKVVKYWDMDRFELLLALEGHQADIWCLAVSHLGDFVITGSHDRSLRRWERTDEPFFVEEEMEKRLESLFEKDSEADTTKFQSPWPPSEGANSGSGAPAGRRTLESHGAVDAIVDALDMAAAEVQRRREVEEERRQRAEGRALVPNPLMMGLSPSKFVLRAVCGVRAADVEQALLMLPFSDALRLLRYLSHWLRRGMQVELCCRIATLLTRLHLRLLMASPSARPVLMQLHRRLHGAAQGLKDTLGFNLAALTHLARSAKERSTTEADGTFGRLVKRKAGALTMDV